MNEVLALLTVIAVALVVLPARFRRPRRDFVTMRCGMERPSGYVGETTLRICDSQEEHLDNVEVTFWASGTLQVSANGRIILSRLLRVDGSGNRFQSVVRLDKP